MNSILCTLSVHYIYSFTLRENIEKYLFSFAFSRKETRIQPIRKSIAYYKYFCINICNSVQSLIQSRKYLIFMWNTQNIREKQDGSTINLLADMLWPLFEKVAPALHDISGPILEKLKPFLNKYKNGGVENKKTAYSAFDKLLRNG